MKRDHLDVLDEAQHALNLDSFSHANNPYHAHSVLEAAENKTKREERVEKHSRLLKYMENKRLKEELDFIDSW